MPFVDIVGILKAPRVHSRQSSRDRVIYPPLSEAMMCDGWPVGQASERTSEPANGRMDRQT